MRRLLRCEWCLIGASVLAVFVVGSVGFYRYYLASGEPISLLDSVYLSLQLFTIESGALDPPVNAWLQSARFLAPLIAAYTAVRAFTLLFYDRYKQFRARSFKDHVIICGLGEKGLRLATDFIDRGSKVVVIEQDESSDSLATVRRRGGTVFVGDATDEDMLRRARVEAARYLVATCGDDGTNSVVAVRARKLQEQRRRGSLNCVTHITDPRLCRLLKERELEVGGGDRFRLEFFNIYSQGAQILLRRHPPFDLYGTTDATRPHILLIGLSSLGESVLLGCAKAWARRAGSEEAQLRLSLLEASAESKYRSLCQKRPHLARYFRASVSELDVDTMLIPPELMRTWQSTADSPALAYVCIEDDTKCISAGLAVLKARTGFPVVVCMSQDSGLADLLRAEVRDDFRNLHGFSLLDEACSSDLLLAGTHELMARTVHDAYLRKELDKGRQLGADDSMLQWDQLSEDKKEGNRLQADDIARKIAMVGCSIIPQDDWGGQPFEFSSHEIELLAEEEHRRWVEAKREAGWKRGSVKSSSEKTHPDLIDWHDLSEPAKEKDRNAVREIPSLLSLADMAMFRGQ